jgi:GNAT superfamily N-acetyltransferase
VTRIEPFEDRDIAAATELLATRHARHRVAEPLLDDGVAGAALERAWRTARTSGVVARRDGAVTGYLFGRRGGGVFGEHVFVERAGSAADEPEIMRDLYAAAAPAWLASGARRHLVLVPATDAFLDPWYRLGFAQMHVEAIRPTGAEAVPLPHGVAIRQGGIVDIEVALGLAHVIGDIQQETPSYAGVSRRSAESLRADWIETLEDPSTAYFIVERDGEPVGHSTLYRPDPELGNPADTLYLASTLTVRSLHGQGIGRALVAHVLRWARETGHGTVVTNWRVTNLLASRFWPARGWRQTFIRMDRTLPAP